MKTIKHFTLLLLCTLLFVAATLAQSTAQDVTIIIQQEQVRFTSQKAVQVMQLQIVNQSGERIYDSGPTTVADINWPLQNSDGTALKSGLYAYTLSIQEAGATTARVRRGHFIVDRAKDRDGKTDKLWVTSQNESGIGTELTVARNEDSTVAGTSAASERTSVTERDSTQRDVAGRGETTSPTKTAKATTEAVTGTVGQIAKFTSATDVGNSVMIEKNGNIGIGTTKPTTSLDVNGIVQSNQGLNAGEFRIGGSTVLSAQDGSLLTLNAGQFATVSIPNGNVGIGTTSPTSKLEIAGQDGLKINGFQPFLTLTDSNAGNARGVIQQVGGGLNLFTNSYLTGANLQAYFRLDNSGNVGLGLATPLSKLHVLSSPSQSPPRLESSGTTSFAAGWDFYHGTTGKGFVGVPGTTAGIAPGEMILFGGQGTKTSLWANTFRALTVATNGNIGIGTATPGTKLHIESPGYAEMKIESTNERAILSLTNRLNPQGYTWTLESGVGGQFPSLFGIYNRNVNKSGLTIDGNLLVSVKALQITGGADFAENFDINAASTTEIQPGMVVAIDPTNPGKLSLSQRAYDRRVAGIISGAGNVETGMRMGQAGTLADGKHPVALSGRVYVWVDGAVKAGDLLTTSTTPGYAMKATNRARAQGAILGKAMTSLKAGKGLVLVLVTLQ